MSNVRRLRSAVLAGVALIATACGSAGPSAAAGGAGGVGSSSSLPAAVTPTTAQSVAPGRPLHWTACQAAQGPAGFQCATVRVPLDYADVKKGTIGIALDRRPARQAAIGSLLVYPGGPGESGIDFLAGFVSEVPAAMLDHFNLVGFDPRGVGRSDPVTCGARQVNAELNSDPAPTTEAGFNAMLATAKEFAAGCEASSGRILPYVGTVNAARDMDRIRIALGQPKLDYLGFSYGTYLGAEYAELYPTHVRAMVLDGALDPALGQVATDDTQATALERELTAFFASCANGTCGWKPSGSYSAALRALVTQVTAHPLAVSGTTQVVNPAVVLFGSASALYNPQDWPILGQALKDLEAGSGGPILQLFDEYFQRASNGTYSNLLDAETAVDCVDHSEPDPAQLKAASPLAVKDAPFFGLLDLYGSAPCPFWPVKPTGQTGPIRATGSPPIVVVGSTGDPVTPYAWAQALASQLQHGVLLTRDGYGHSAYGFSSCIRTDVDNYLLYLKVPPKGTTCPSD